MASNAVETDEAMATADKEMEERAIRARQLLSDRYRGLRSDQVSARVNSQCVSLIMICSAKLTQPPCPNEPQEAKHGRKMQLERRMLGLAEEKKQTLRVVLEQEEVAIQKESRKTISTADFESLAVIGRGAFGEVRLARRKTKDLSDPDNGQIFALKSMKKEMMVIKNQVGHVKAERDALAKAETSNRWLTSLHYSFTDESHLYMVMEFLPGGDLMSLLMKEDTFSETVTRFFMAEAAHAISCVHALGYIHRDIKPDNMLLDSRGHLKLTDLGLCKKVGEVSPEDHPEVVLEMMRKQSLGETNNDSGDYEKAPPGGASGMHRSHGDPNAMSIDDPHSVGIAPASAPKPHDYPTGKAKREVSLAD